MILDVLGVESADRLAVLHAASFERPWPAADFRALLAAPGVAALGVEEGGLLRGFILLRAVAGEAEVLTLAVDPAARRRGLGRALVESAAGALPAVETLFLEVAADNAAALALYRSAGFEAAGLRRGYYDRGPDAPRVDAHLLRRALPSPPRNPYPAPRTEA